MTILRTIIGSQCHGLATPESDVDTREVFVLPTEELLRVNPPTEKAKTKGDDVSWEVGHFLKLALRCNPTILEVMAAPSTYATKEGAWLQGLFPDVLSKTAVWKSFTGYATSQRHRLDEATVLLTNGNADSEKRRRKALAARLRILSNGIELLKTGTMTVRIADVPVIGEQVRRAKFGEMTNEEGAEIATKLLEEIDAAYAVSLLNDAPNIENVNRYLLSVRRAHLSPT